MCLRKYVSLGVGALLGMFLPRNDGGTPTATLPTPGAGVTGADAEALARADALEAANRRVLELEGLTEEKIRQQAEQLVHEIFPQAGLPDEAPGRYARPADDGTPPEPPTIEQQVEELRARVSNNEIEDASRELQSVIERAVETKYPNADKFRVLGQIARSGNQEINVEKLIEVSHNVETKRLDNYYNARRAAEANDVRTNKPPPIPNNPGGIPLPGAEKPTMKTATSLLVKGMMEKMGWGKTP